MFIIYQYDYTVYDFNLKLKNLVSRKTIKL